MKEDLNKYIKKSHVRAVEKFNDDLEAFARETGESPVTLYENAFVSFTLANVRLEDGYLYYDYDGQTECEMIVCTDEETGKLYETEYAGIMEYLKFWRSCLRRSKRYWQMDPYKLDRIQDGETDDSDDDEEDEDADNVVEEILLDTLTEEERQQLEEKYSDRPAKMDIVVVKNPRGNVFRVMDDGSVAIRVEVTQEEMDETIDSAFSQASTL